MKKLLRPLFPQWLKNLYHGLSAMGASLYYGFPSKELTIIAVTGTDGKTTTATLIYHLLSSAGHKTALISTVAAYIAQDEIDIGFHVTSPNPWLLQRLIKHIKNRNISYLVLEVTSHGLDQHRLLGVRPKVAVLTNITHEHLDYHKNYPQYVKAKAKLFKHADICILNQDDASFHQLKPLINPKSQIITYSQKDNLPYEKAIQNNFRQSYNQQNARAASLVAQEIGCSIQTIEENLATFPGIPGRLERMPNQKNLRLIIDFAHTPNALKSVLKNLKDSTTGNLIAVYGAAGQRDAQKRPLMGNIGAQLADYVILTAEDPRTENVHSIIYQMKQGIKRGHHKVISISNRTKAIDYAINQLAQPGDTVAILGKGHEKTMNLDGTSETPYSDKQAIIEALSEAA